MMNKSFTFLTFSLVLLLGGQASAESIAYKDPRLGGQTVFVQIEYRSQKSCDYLASASRGAPAGAAVRQEQLPVTVVVARDGACSNVARRLHMNKTVYVNLLQYDVKLFFVAPNGRLLNMESMSITER